MVVVVWGYFSLPCFDCFISRLGLTYILQKSVTRIKETLFAPDVPSPKWAGHSSSHGAGGRSFEPTLIFSISILIKPSSSILLSSSYSEIPKRCLCQLPSLDFKAFMGEETFQSIITTQNLYQRLLESWNYQWLSVNNCWSKWWIRDNPSQAILLWEWEKQLEGIHN